MTPSARDSWLLGQTGKIIAAGIQGEALSADGLGLGEPADGVFPGVCDRAG